ncbi:hypothetical protein [Paenibacillus montanisoli]|uniref:Uncharacterized protein n=1 Tax=Paenibacillus montanisoli TaxID=2081970 RepID=A0A328UEM1_9BACL|nr:hypothetical protein [Paenibacillus montanisoli]RAP78396.1 hypothetical protein DL346_08220 [Paenibacillus montanisoli]
MNRVQGVVKMYARDKWGWFYLPWIILLSSFLVNLIIAAFLPMDEKIVTGGLMSIFIYMMVAGILSMFQTFPFALGMSVRRHDFFMGTMLMITLISIGISVILCLLSFIEGDVIDGWGVRLYFFHLPYISDGGILSQLVIYFSVMLNLYMIGFLWASLHRRFGKSGVYVLAIAGLIIITLLLYMANYFEWWPSIRDFFIGFTALDIALWLLPITVCLSVGSYLLLRRATV